MAVLNPSVKCRSFPGRKAYDVLLAYTNRVEKAVTARSKQFRICCTARIPCQGDPVLISYQAHKLALENNLRSELGNLFRHDCVTIIPGDLRQHLELIECNIKMKKQKLWVLLKELIARQQKEDTPIFIEPSQCQGSS